MDEYNDEDEEMQDVDESDVEEDMDFADQTDSEDTSNTDEEDDLEEDNDVTGEVGWDQGDDEDEDEDDLVPNEDEANEDDEGGDDEDREDEGGDEGDEEMIWQVRLFSNVNSFVQTHHRTCIPVQMGWMTMRGMRMMTKEVSGNTSFSEQPLTLIYSTRPHHARRSGGRTRCCL